MDEKPKKTPSLLKRDEHGQLIDPQQGHKEANALLDKLMNEKRLHEKDSSFHISRTGRRDVVVHLAVTVLGQVDGKRIIGEQDKEYNQYCFVFPARALPARRAKLDRAFAELATFGRQALMRLGMVTD